MSAPASDASALLERKQVALRGDQPRLTMTEAERRLEIANELLDRSKIVEMIDGRIEADRTTNRGAPVTVGTRTVLLGILLAVLDNRALYLTQAYSALAQLPKHLQLEVGFLRRARPSETKADGLLRTYVSYEALTRAYTRICDTFGKTRTEVTGGGKGHRSAMSAGTAEIVDRILDASVTVDVDPKSGAIDSTGIYGNVNQRTRGKDLADSADPETGWYVREEKGIRILGYSLTVVIAKAQDNSSTVVLAMELQSGNANDTTSGADLMRRGVAKTNALRRIEQIAGDKAYSSGRQFFDAAQDAGKYVVFDPDEHQRGFQGIHAGHPVVDNTLFCPCLSEDLHDAGPAPSVFNDVDPAAFKAIQEKREPFRLPLFGRADTDGSSRFQCPVLAKKARCTRRQADSQAVDASKPLIAPTDETPVAAACDQRTTSTPGQVAGQQMQPQYPYGSDAWKAAYGGPRSRVEGVFGTVKTGHGRIRRGGFFVQGLAKVALFLALNLAIENLRRCGTFTTRRHQDTAALRAEQLTEEDFTPEGWARHQAKIASARDGRAPPEPVTPIS